MDSLPPFLDAGIREATPNACDKRQKRARPILKSLYGLMVKKAHGRLDGWRMSSQDKWLAEEKSSVRLIVGILLSFGLIYFAFFHRPRPEFRFNGVNYKLVGVAKISEKDNLMVPVYQEEKK